MLSLDLSFNKAKDVLRTCFRVKHMTTIFKVTKKVHFYVNGDTNKCVIPVSLKIWKKMFTKKQRLKGNINRPTAGQWRSTGEGPRILLEPLLRTSASEPYFKPKNLTIE